MIQRFDTGTDIAEIGARDISRAEPVPSFRSRLSALDADADAGHLFSIRTGGDGGWLVEVRLGEPPPDPALYQSIEREVLLRAPGGRVKVGGVEDYRSSNPPGITSEADVFELPPGNYAVRLYLSRATEAEGPVTISLARADGTGTPISAIETMKKLKSLKLNIELCVDRILSSPEWRNSVPPTVRRRGH